MYNYTYRCVYIYIYIYCEFWKLKSKSQATTPGFHYTPLFGAVAFGGSCTTPARCQAVSNQTNTAPSFERVRRRDAENTCTAISIQLRLVSTTTPLCRM